MIKYIILIHLGMTVFTFGHSAANTNACNYPRFWTGNELKETRCRAGHGTVAAFVYPLYWSWVVSDKLGGHD